MATAYASSPTTARLPPRQPAPPPPPMAPLQVQQQQPRQPAITVARSAAEVQRSPSVSSVSSSVSSSSNHQQQQQQQPVAPLSLNLWHVQPDEDNDNSRAGSLHGSISNLHDLHQQLEQQHLNEERERAEDADDESDTEVDDLEKIRTRRLTQLDLGVRYRAPALDDPHSQTGTPNPSQQQAQQQQQQQQSQPQPSSGTSSSLNSANANGEWALPPPLTPYTGSVRGSKSSGGTFSKAFAKFRMSSNSDAELLQQKVDLEKVNETLEKNKKRYSLKPIVNENIKSLASEADPTVNPEVFLQKNPDELLKRTEARMQSTYKGMAPIQNGEASNFDNIGSAKIVGQDTFWSSSDGGSGKKFSVFFIELRRGSQTNCIIRRYHDFHDMQKSLLNETRYLDDVPRLPPKPLKQGSSSVEAIAQLNKYLESLINRKNRFCFEVAFQTFFASTEKDKQNDAFNDRLAKKGIDFKF